MFNDEIQNMQPPHKTMAKQETAQQYNSMKILRDFIKF